MQPAVMSVEELYRFLRVEFPEVFNSDGGVSIERVSAGGCVVRQAYREYGCSYRVTRGIPGHDSGHEQSQAFLERAWSQSGGMELIRSKPNAGRS